MQNQSKAARWARCRPSGGPFAFSVRLRRCARCVLSVLAACWQCVCRAPRHARGALAVRMRCVSTRLQCAAACLWCASACRNAFAVCPRRACGAARGADECRWRSLLSFSATRLFGLNAVFWQECDNYTRSECRRFFRGLKRPDQKGGYFALCRTSSVNVGLLPLIGLLPSHSSRLLALSAESLAASFSKAAASLRLRRSQRLWCLRRLQRSR